MQRYIALVDREERNGRPVWGVSFPDFPGCVAVGNSFQHAVDSAAEALRFHVEGMLADGLSIPEPRELESIAADSDWAEDLRGAAVTCLVPLLPPSKAPERVNISMDGGLLREIDSAAEALGSTRSGFLAEAARDRLEALAIGTKAESRSQGRKRA
ncbi:MAG TPA: type II toxin-antitoxin system HicB family antitoxin [Methylomirabilota bacterium]|jgi:predicted RNase H-like HicB family nuclease|nr:type II toxin-antitoxin system HicB family antitoxin [Methylomirabilota bacterium]